MERDAPAVGSPKDRMIYEAPDYPLRSDNPEATVEERHGWVIPLAWRFISEVYECERKSVTETEYDHESEVGIIR